MHEKTYKPILLLFLLLIYSCATEQETVQESTMTKDKMKIIYVFDPLCGWCYGFEPVMEKVQANYGSDFEFEVISEGMVMPENERPVSELREFLENAIPALEDRTGISISKAYYDNILHNDSIVLNSVLPSRVFFALKPYCKYKEVELARKIQDLLYQQGLDIGKYESYTSLFQEYSPEQVNTIEAFVSTEAVKTGTQKMFNQSQQMRVSGFPALLFEHEEKTYNLNIGYTSYENMAELLGKVKKKFN